MPASLPDGPLQIVSARGYRRFHYLWHLVRRPADLIEMVPSPERRDQLKHHGWDPGDAIEGTDAGGIAFLAMHRTMCREFAAVKEMAGWKTIPLDHDDAEWPMPKWNWTTPPTAKTQNVTDHWHEAAAILRHKGSILNYDWGLTLGAYGTAIEGGIHAWMHNHWAEEKPLDESQFSDDPSNDWLAAAYSSHVNIHFWKLHGWIDDCIGVWAEAQNKTQAQVDTILAPGWRGAPGGHAHHGSGGVHSVSDEDWRLVQPPGDRRLTLLRF